MNPHKETKKKKEEEEVKNTLYLCVETCRQQPKPQSSFEHIARALITESEQFPSNLQVPLCFLISKQILILTFIKLQKAIFLPI